jgi:hypothetical protein
LFIAFAASPWGEEYGDAIDFYGGITFLVLLALLTVLTLQDWWSAQETDTTKPGVGLKASRIATLLEWWRRWETDWDWKRRDKR